MTHWAMRDSDLPANLRDYATRNTLPLLDGHPDGRDYRTNNEGPGYSTAVADRPTWLTEAHGPHPADVVRGMKLGRRARKGNEVPEDA